MKKKRQIIKIRGLSIGYTSDMVTIYNSYTVTSEKAKYEICEEILNKIKNYDSQRTIKSLVDE